MRPKIFAGLEEIIARLFAAFLTILLFVVFVAARGSIDLEWRAVASWLVAFWFGYELASIVLFNIFVFFAGRDNQVDPTINTETLDVETQE
jgi:uncharacterized membrane protein